MKHEKLNMNDSAVGGEIISESEMSSDEGVEKVNCFKKCVQSIHI
jgi:hypothetical protein